MSNSDHLRPRHPIRVVSQRTGLTPAALRAWERRYGAVRPSRSEAGQRIYSDQDVERLRTLRELTDHGRPISTVAALTLEAAEALLREDRAASTSTLVASSSAKESAEVMVHRAYARLQKLDASGLEHLCWHAAITLGAETFLDEVVTPLLSLVGEGWSAGQLTPAQEHVGSEVLERVLDRIADRVRSTDGPNLVVATLPGEQHGLGARLVSTAATLEGWCVTYLGTDLPVVDIASAVESVGGGTVAISVVGQNNLGQTVAALSTLRERLGPAIDVIIGGAGAQLIETSDVPAGVTVLHGIDGLRNHLRRTRSAQYAL
jgi:DNA-binding transcriptional MerR regulator/methylmalonyl-CoA mutase cobalamin-binding subunit